jgi:hypothetical protein
LRACAAYRLGGEIGALGLILDVNVILLQLGNHPLEPLNLLLLEFKVLEIAIGRLDQRLIVFLESLNLQMLVSQFLLHGFHLRLVLFKDGLGVAKEETIRAGII